MNSVGLYVRVSTQEQKNHGYSIAEQTDRLQKYAEAMGWPVYKVYTDAGFSGSSMNRPALMQMLRDLSDGRFQRVVVYKLDRLSRSQRDTLEIIEERILAHGADFVSMSENFDTGTPFGRATIGFLAVFAQLEREQIKERMQMGRKARIKAGKFKGNRTPPIGYTYVGGELRINDDADQVKQLFELAKDHMTPGQIAAEMDGVCHAFGPWTPRQVRKALRNRVYIGMVSYREEWFPGIHVPIVDRETFEDVQAFLNTRTMAHQQGGREGKVTSYLGGLIYCAQCGGKYSKRTTRRTVNGKQYLYEVYVCNSRAGKKGVRVSAECRNRIWKCQELEELIFGEIGKLATEPLKERKERKETQLEKVRKKIEKTEKELSRLIDLYAVGKMPVNILQEKVWAMQEKKDELEEQEARIIEQTTPRTSPEQAREAVLSFSDVLQHGSFEDVRSVVTDLIDRIEIDGDDVTIFWAFS